jgi:hypothetical protein
MTVPGPRPKFDLLRVLVAVAIASVPVVLWYEGETRAAREQLDVEASRLGRGSSPPHPPHPAIDESWSGVSVSKVGGKRHTSGVIEFYRK